MADQFVAEIRMVGFNFATTGWATCDGQLLPISQNTALFSLLGTTYGGDGKSTFALPHLTGNSPMHWGQGGGLTDRFLGEESGSENVALLQTEMPQHTHLIQGTGDPATAASPNNGVWAVSGSRRSSTNLYTSSTPAGIMNATALQVVGSSLPHNNMPPYLTVLFIIALQGIFPARP